MSKEEIDEAKMLGDKLGDLVANEASSVNVGVASILMLLGTVIATIYEDADVPEGTQLTQFTNDTVTIKVSTKESKVDSSILH
jgi:hypothetical protein